MPDSQQYKKLQCLQLFLNNVMVFTSIKSDPIRTSPEMVFPLLSAFCIISVSGVTLSSAFIHRAKPLFSTECQVQPSHYQ